MNTSKIISSLTSLKTAVLGILVVLLAGGCEKAAIQTLPERNWELAWSDDFTGAAGSAPDAGKWAFDIGTGSNGWGNSELQYYTNRPENIKLDGNGMLVITAKSESYAGSGFTSARIKTKGLFAQQYGRFEARIKTPTGPGLWPAFWMLGANIDTKPWPQCGEIDIMEQRGQQPSVTWGSVHGPGYSGGGAISKPYGLVNGRFDTEFHVYAVEWGEDYIDYFVDNYLFQRITPETVTGDWVYNTPFFLLLNVAVGGNFVGFPTTGTPFPQSMYVDYVKVYKQK
ncbi:MAG TPA: glycoside hydrolase family 16 protein [Ferruginibacter sp.]|jgi:beta-glucanase (GH16 family)|nr:glycoside hydrolase family 16 protein [Chitinophagales bacterium]HMW26153.1 glycoside hydrolase family 16 protein [Ferruginibacter sp.]HMX35706.1 glycoside hydrolase family 16 protein [Ferruginibacter sp.]HNA14964.1 glycoside hydrolase family 16 protein [Ferruginibacter sp.]HNF00740.1 glycoside hydrolase family 16 protein [Ferruginibacter sp.]